MIKQIAFYIDDVVAGLENRREMRSLRRTLWHRVLSIGEALVNKYVEQATTAACPPARPSPDAGFDFDDSIEEKVRYQRVDVPVFYPEPPERLEVGDTVVYESWTEIVQPGESVSVPVGIPEPISGTGWPGLPETMQTAFGPAEDFQSEKITISPGFKLVGAFSGAQNMMRGTHIEVPAEHLASDAPQPDYPIAHKHYQITIQVKNGSDKPRPCRVRVRGKKVSGRKGVE